MMLVAGADVQIQTIKKQSFFLRSQFRIRIKVGNDQKINNRTKRFDQVIGKIELILCTVMMDAQYRKKAISCQMPGNAAPQDRITIIHRRVQSVIQSAKEISPHQRGEIILRRYRLNIISITGAHFFCHIRKSRRRVISADQSQTFRLINYLRFYDALP